MPGNGGFVYAIGPEASTALVKLGRTRDPNGVAERLGSLQRQGPVALTCFAAIPCVDKRDLATTEWAVHDMFHEDRQHGEWFSRSRRLNVAIAKIARTFGGIVDATCIPEAVVYLRREEERRIAAAEQWEKLVQGWRRRFFPVSCLELPPPPLPPAGFYDDCGTEWDGTGFTFVNAILRSELVLS